MVAAVAVVMVLLADALFLLIVEATVDVVTLLRLPVMLRLRDTAVATAAMIHPRIVATVNGLPAFLVVVVARTTTVVVGMRDPRLPVVLSLL
jgi:hypothetical protein